MYFQKQSIIFCGTLSESTPITVLRDELRNFLGNLNDEDLIEFNRRIEFQLPEDQGYEANQISKELRIHGLTLILFLAATAAIFIWPIYS